MVMHSQEIEGSRLTEHENNLWWEMDKIAVENSERTPESTRLARSKKAKAAVNMMSFLQRPTHKWCQEKYESEIK